MEVGFGNGRGPLIPKREEHIVYPEDEELPIEDELFHRVAEESDESMQYNQKKLTVDK